MKLVILIGSMSSGGAERVTANLANYWSQKGWQITIVTMTATERDFYQLNPQVKRIGLDLANESKGAIDALFRNMKRIQKTEEIIKREQPNVVLAMMTAANIWVALTSSRFKNIVFVGSEHNYPPRASAIRIWNQLRKYLYKKLDAVTALTSETREWIQNNTNAKRVPIIPNPIWPFDSHRPIVDTPNKEKDKKILLAAGRLVSQKGFDLLLKAFSKISDEFFNWELYILGEGHLREELEREVESLGLRNKVYLSGCVGNIRDWYEWADIYVMSSRFEGFGNTLAEAMACGLPVISFDCNAGPRDIIRQGVDGLLISTEDVNALADGLKRLMGDAELRQKFASKAIEVRERFSIEKIASIWETLFLELKNKNV